MLIRSALLIVFSILLIPSDFRAHEAAETQTKLQVKVSQFSLQAADFAHALVSFADKFKLPIGIEWARSPQTTKKVDLTWRSRTVQQMLDDLVKTQGDYQIEAKGPILHVFQKQSDVSPQNFLNLKIDRFEVRNQVVEVASHKLRDLVRPRISPDRLSAEQAGGMGYSQATNVGDPKFEMTLKDVRVRDVLDHLAVASDRKIWIVTFVAEPPTMPTGYRRTVTLWNNEPVPDAEQPVWDMLRWSDSLP